MTCMATFFFFFFFFFLLSFSFSFSSYYCCCCQHHHYHFFPLLLTCTAHLRTVVASAVQRWLSPSQLLHCVLPHSVFYVHLFIVSFLLSFCLFSSHYTCSLLHRTLYRLTASFPICCLPLAGISSIERASPAAHEELGFHS